MIVTLKHNTKRKLYDLKNSLQSLFNCKTFNVRLYRDTVMKADLY